MVEITMDYFRMLHKPITLSPLFLVDMRTYQPLWITFVCYINQSLLVENENIPITVECLLHKPIALH